MYAFQLYGFKIKAIIRDGASTNLLAIKILAGFGSGAYGYMEEGAEDVHEVQAWFTNPMEECTPFVHHNRYKFT